MEKAAEADKMKCRYCNSGNIVKAGIRNNKIKGKSQRYLCKDCRRKFVLDEGFLSKKFSGSIIMTCLDLYFSGLSFRKIKQHLKRMHNISLSHSTIYYWIKNYSSVISNYTSNLKLENSESWNADETTLFFKGRPNWLWDIIDTKSRFLVALDLTAFRFCKKENVFTKSRLIVSNQPKIVTTDGFRGYSKMIKQSFPEAEHKVSEGIRGRGLNNKIERFQGNIKERYKVMRGFSDDRSARIILEGWKNYYNFVRPHMALGGRTPSEVAGLNIELGVNKWSELIRRGSELR